MNGDALLKAPLRDARGARRKTVHRSCSIPLCRSRTSQETAKQQILPLPFGNYSSILIFVACLHIAIKFRRMSKLAARGAGAASNSTAECTCSQPHRHATVRKVESKEYTCYKLRADSRRSGKPSRAFQTACKLFIHAVLLWRNVSTHRCARHKSTRWSAQASCDVASRTCEHSTVLTD